MCNSISEDLLADKGFIDPQVSRIRRQIQPVVELPLPATWTIVQDNRITGTDALLNQDNWYMVILGQSNFYLIWRKFLSSQSLILSPP